MNSEEAVNDPKQPRKKWSAAEKKALTHFALAVDGVQLRFPEAPRGLPDHLVPQMFWSRKQFYSINCQVDILKDYILLIKNLQVVANDSPGLSGEGRELHGEGGRD